jgi:hypothetical protein
VVNRGKSFKIRKEIIARYFEGLLRKFKEIQHEGLIKKAAYI